MSNSLLRRVNQLEIALERLSAVDVDGGSYYQPAISRISTTDSTPAKIQIKTNIAQASNVMYWIKLEGYNYGGGGSNVINSVAVGYSYSGGDQSLVNTRVENWGGGLSVSQYISGDGFVCLEAASNSFYFAGFSIHAMTPNPANTGYQISVSEWVQSEGRY